MSKKCQWCNEEHKNYNTGCKNSGDHNSGDRNSGNYNSGDYNSGWFNTNEPKMRFFNKDSEVTYSEFIKGKIVYPGLKICSRVNIDDLEEKTGDAIQIGGLLKTLTYKEAWEEYWGRASEEDKKWFQSLPNFTWDIFTSITGIEPEQNALTPITKIDEVIELNGRHYKRID